MSWFDDLLGSDLAKAALAGGAIAATGGAAAPAVLGAEAATAGGAGLLAAEGAGAAAAGSGGLLGSAAAADPLAAYMATGATEGSTMGSALTGAGGASGAVGQGTMAGTMGQIKQAADYMKPIGQAASAAGQVKGLLADDPARPIQGAPVMQSQGGSQALSGLYQQLEQNNLQRQQQEAQKRLQRRQSMGGM